MAQSTSNSAHDDMIHDAVLDYYGRRLATCSSDKTIKIFEVEGETQRLTETLRGHDSPIWSLSWAHPKHGTLLASAAFDGRVFIWNETAPGQWARAYEHALHTASVNLVAWAPHEAGCLLACASSDGTVSVLEAKDAAGGWSVIAHFPAHGMGVNSVSWAPGVQAGAAGVAVGGPGAAARRFVTGGSDCLVKIWEWQQDAGTWTAVHELQGHGDWVRDVSWAPTVLAKSYIASASQDKTVRIWTSTGGRANCVGEWTSTSLPFDAAAWRVSWSLSGNVLAISTNNNKVSLWKERLSGGWEKIKSIEE
ncbi:Sec13 protein-like protein [Trichodelitschia bisporula]|uniref:Protein transport protein SEC13 n=1 Tax=Trichodelitschia bisporula TaxID=703511 RepID=A0A6G1HZ64_9PEZI|nr:Sec13 protein-like protein [Trichodelitschia bisporula]